jgi:hypothetical protein
MSTRGEGAESVEGSQRRVRDYLPKGTERTAKRGRKEIPIEVRLQRDRDTFEKKLNNPETKEIVQRVNGKLEVMRKYGLILPVNAQADWLRPAVFLLPQIFPKILGRPGIATIPRAALAALLNDHGVPNLQYQDKTWLGSYGDLMGYASKKVANQSRQQILFLIPPIGSHTWEPHLSLTQKGIAVDLHVKVLEGTSLVPRRLAKMRQRELYKALIPALFTSTDIRTLNSREINIPPASLISAYLRDICTDHVTDLPPNVKVYEMNAHELEANYPLPR